MRRKHPAFVARLNHEESAAEGEELPAGVAVRRGPVFGLAAVEGESHRWHSAFVEATEIFNVDFGLGAAGLRFIGHDFVTFSFLPSHGLPVACCLPSE